MDASNKNSKLIITFLCLIAVRVSISNFINGGSGHFGCPLMIIKNIW